MWKEFQTEYNTTQPIVNDDYLWLSYSQRASRMNPQLQTYFIHRFDFSIMKWFFEASIAQL